MDLALEALLCKMCSNGLRMEQRELRHDRHTVSLLTDYMVYGLLAKISREDSGREDDRACC